MPQLQLPLFPAGSKEISANLACAFCENTNTVSYLIGCEVVFTHAQDDLASFRLFTSQLIANGQATQTQIQEAFGVPLVSIKRSCKKYREKGAKGFFEPPPRRGAPRLTEEKLAQARVWIEQGCDLKQLSEKIGVNKDTLRKAIQAHRLPAIKKNP